MSTSRQLPEDMRSTINWTAGTLGGIGFISTFTPHWDVSIIVAAWVRMTLKLAKQADLHLDRDQAFKIVTGVLIGVGGIASGVKIANTTLAYTGLGTLPAMCCNAGTNAVVTRVIGSAIGRVFLSEDRAGSVAQIIIAILRILRPGGGSAIA